MDDGEPSTVTRDGVLLFTPGGRKPDVEHRTTETVDARAADAAPTTTETVITTASTDLAARPCTLAIVRRLTRPCRFGSGKQQRRPLVGTRLVPRESTTRGPRATHREPG